MFFTVYCVKIKIYHQLSHPKFKDALSLDLRVLVEKQVFNNLWHMEFLLFGFNLLLFLSLNCTVIYIIWFPF